MTNLLIVNQNFIDLIASVLILLTSVVQDDATGMSYYSASDQFVCRIWVTRYPLWGMLISSTYSILAVSLERYVAIVHPIYYKVCTLNVNRTKTNFNVDTEYDPLTSIYIISSTTEINAFY
jgi:hypothetical protein